MSLKDDVTAAIRRVFQLGQTYWQQADSESYRENAKSDATLERYRALCVETAEIAARADARIAELERECSQWRDELRIYRETESARIAELEQSVTVRDTEIARLETDLELARMDGALLKQIERAAELLPNGYQVQLTVENGSAWVEMFDGRWWTHTERDGVTLADEVSAAVDAAIEEARAGNGGEG